MSRKPKCERSHSDGILCDGCGLPFTPKRPWQRRCGSPKCRAAASRRRRARQLRELFDRLRGALETGDIDKARALLRSADSSDDLV
jgi:hypothetical protein